MGARSDKTHDAEIRILEFSTTRNRILLSLMTTVVQYSYCGHKSTVVLQKTEILQHRRRIKTEAKAKVVASVCVT